ncbi:putative ubiquitin activating enzyme [Trypanosoma rangeli]|uniref:NEDD8-activating enzyme E1 catalytic subunit n=1 Tax=Trypanosoma rangeli TaxID=5698 RepID=A0A422NGT4_TRYRA|nr:putative ubiquitin activating enzyme [Trypanosoma rangeli]RNF04672.1 putative ubiquitin activating enzyme [Trypanosoma rangeli]|eukprot:RNF04672.1 putative ubiquitin activating enzyme [Trypanosoma rangeli]
MSGVGLRTPFTTNERGLQHLVRRSPPPAFAVAGYNAENTTWDEVRLLLVGAGGIGCEVLHTLALSGFTDITVVDMDTIELSNLNRQFLFSEADIGRSKAEVAAAFVERRCPGVRVNAVFGRLEDQHDGFYRQFHVVILAVDSVAARRWMNQKIAELAVWEIVDVTREGSTGNKEKRITSSIPFIDTGTEGYEASCRVIRLDTGTTACIECDLDIYPPRKTVPFCTLENVPRSPAHCVLYVQFRLWNVLRPGETLDSDNAAHIEWIRSEAQKRKELFCIMGPDIDFYFVLGVVKNVVPAVGFTNALVAGQASLELIKLLTGVAPSMQCFSYFNGAADCGGLTSYVTELSPNPACPVCAPRPVLLLTSHMQPQDVLAAVEEQIDLPTVVRDAGEPQEGPWSDGTLWVRFEDGAEVYLLYKKNNPLRAHIVGSTIEEIFATSGHADAFTRWCSGGGLTFTVRYSSANVHVSAEALMSRSVAV